MIERFFWNIKIGIETKTHNSIFLKTAFQFVAFLVYGYLIIILCHVQVFFLFHKWRFNCYYNYYTSVCDYIFLSIFGIHIAVIQLLVYAELIIVLLSVAYWIIKVFYLLLLLLFHLFLYLYWYFFIIRIVFYK